MENMKKKPNQSSRGAETPPGQVSAAQEPNRDAAVWKATEGGESGAPPASSNSSTDETQTPNPYPNVSDSDDLESLGRVDNLLQKENQKENQKEEPNPKVDALNKRKQDILSRYPPSEQSVPPTELNPSPSQPQPNQDLANQLGSTQESDTTKDVEPEKQIGTQDSSVPSPSEQQLSNARLADQLDKGTPSPDTSTDSEDEIKM